MGKLKKGWVKVDLGQLMKAEWNYKTENSEKSKKLTANLKRNGQVENILIRELNGKYEVVNGNHRLDGFREAGIVEPMCYNLGKISDKAAQRIAVETNETRFESDPLKLAEIISGLTKEFGLLDIEQTTPFLENELKDFELLLNWDWSQYDNKDPAADGGEEWIKVEVNVSRETYEQWLSWIERVKDIFNDDRPGRAFEIAVVESLNIPAESLR